MSYDDAIKLIGLPVENKRTGRQYTVRDVTDNGRNIWISNGSFCALADFGVFWKVVDDA